MVLHAFVLDHGVPVMTKYMVAIREFSEPLCMELVWHGSELVGVLI